MHTLAWNRPSVTPTATPHYTATSFHQPPQPWLAPLSLQPCGTSTYQHQLVQNQSSFAQAGNQEHSQTRSTLGLPVVPPLPRPSDISTSISHSYSYSPVPPVSSSLVSTPATQPSPAPLLLLRTLTVGSHKYQYQPDTLYPPPLIKYTNNVDLLPQHWESFPLALDSSRTIDIGLKHWKNLYMGTSHWTRLRRYYSKWAVRNHILVYCMWIPSC